MVGVETFVLFFQTVMPWSKVPASFFPDFSLLVAGSIFSNDLLIVTGKSEAIPENSGSETFEKE